MYISGTDGLSLVILERYSVADPGAAGYATDI